MRKIHLIIITFIILTIALGQNVFAEKPSPKPTRAIKAEIEDKKEAREEKRIQLKITKVNEEIDRRIKQLNKLIDLITSAKRINSTQKETLIAQIKDEITKLSNLKVEIAKETDSKKLLELKKQIVSRYKIFGLFSPKINIIAHADNIINLGEKIKKKTSSAAALAKIEESQNVANQAIDLVMKLSPDGWPANKTQLTQARDLLKQARKLLIEAWKLAKDERKGSPLAGDDDDKPKASPTPTVLPIITVTPTPTAIPTVTPTPLPTI